MIYMVKSIKTNRVLEIMNEMGFQLVVPTDEQLGILGVTRQRYHRLLYNKSQIRPLELRAFASWLKVEEKELIGEEETE